MPERIAASVSDAPRKSPIRSAFTWASVARRPVRIGNSFRQKLPPFYADHAHLLKSSPGKPNCRRWGRLVVAIHLVDQPGRED
jgi:hypothetical protein